LTVSVLYYFRNQDIIADDVQAAERYDSYDAALTAARFLHLETYRYARLRNHSDGDRLFITPPPDADLMRQERAEIQNWPRD
jgi:hypothetical protein